MFSFFTFNIILKWRYSIWVFRRHQDYFYFHSGILWYLEVQSRNPEIIWVLESFIQRAFRSPLTVLLYYLGAKLALGSCYVVVLLDPIFWKFVWCPGFLRGPWRSTQDRGLHNSVNFNSHILKKITVV